MLYWMTSLQVAVYGTFFKCHFNSISPHKLEFSLKQDFPNHLCFAFYKDFFLPLPFKLNY